VRFVVSLLTTHAIFPLQTIFPLQNSNILLFWPFAFDEFFWRVFRTPLFV
jgi:hypothetical protein